MNMKDRVREWIENLELTKKEKKTIVLVAIITIIVGLILQNQGNRLFSGILQRNTYGEGESQKVLLVQVEGEDGEAVELEIEVAIQEVAYTVEELEVVFEESILKLDAMILGENETPDYISSKLNLVNEIQGTGISVSWSWEPYGLVTMDGEIVESYFEEYLSGEEDTLLELQGILSYGEAIAIYQKTVHVYKSEQSEAAQIQEWLIDEIQAIDEETKEEEVFVLPTVLDNYKLSWYETKTEEGIIVFLMGGVIILLMLVHKDEERKQKESKRRMELEKDYPQLIQTFALYIGAGMTPKNIWKKIVIEQEEKNPDRYLHIEMKQAYYEMSNGISEVRCYEAFARRCGTRCYQRMGLLLSQNIRKGTKGLTALLEQEAIEAYQMRKNRARKEGEEAGTKLLMPMFLMLAVVLGIVMIPAFLSIQV